MLSFNPWYLIADVFNSVLKVSQAGGELINSADNDCIYKHWL